METLIKDIKIYLQDHTTIRGFSRERLDELIAGKMEGTQGYEWRFLILWSDLYLFEFEFLYNITVNS